MLPSNCSIEYCASFWGYRSSQTIHVASSDISEPVQDRQSFCRTGNPWDAENRSLSSTSGMIASGAASNTDRPEPLCDQHCAIPWRFLPVDSRPTSPFRALRRCGILARATSRSCSVHHPFNCPMFITQRCGKSGFHDFLEDLLVHLLHWAFNPAGSRIRSLRMNRIEVWISSSDLERAFRDADVGESGLAIETNLQRLVTERVHGNEEALQKGDGSQEQLKQEAQERHPVSSA